MRQDRVQWPARDPLEADLDDDRRRLRAMTQPVPRPTPRRPPTPPAEGERRAVAGYAAQYTVAGVLILDALDADLEAIRLADPTAGRVDDLQVLTPGSTRWIPGQVVEDASFDLLGANPRRGRPVAGSPRTARRWLAEASVSEPRSSSCGAPDHQ